MMSYALVAQMAKDMDNAEEVHKAVDKMGYAIGLRLADDLVAQHRAAAVSSASAGVGGDADEFAALGVIRRRCRDVHDAGKVCQLA